MLFDPEEDDVDAFLFFACHDGDMDSVKRAIAHGADMTRPIHIDARYACTLHLECDCRTGDFDGYVFEGYGSALWALVRKKEAGADFLEQLVRIAPLGITHATRALKRAMANWLQVWNQSYVRRIILCLLRSGAKLPPRPEHISVLRYQEFTAYRVERNHAKRKALIVWGIARMRKSASIPIRDIMLLIARAIQLPE